MRYGEQTFLDQQEFLQILEAPWVVELNQALGGILTPDRSILSVGSGLGEHEIPFHLDGYDITASDIVEYALLQTVNLFPGFRAIRFDIFNPDLTVQYDDVLITGLAFYFGSDEAQLIFDNARKLLKPAGSLIFTLRYHNNLATWFIDLVLSPSLAALRNAKFRLTGADLKCVKKCHGYRRSRGEIVAMAQAAGYQLGRVRHAGFGVELNRIELHRFAPGPYRFLRELDKRICVFNNATVFEFLT
ncbi:MAG: hypothetical protein IH968_03935 [Gemmatimonadetes bacterium]|nr:hypothetical protein [Gemmatimonadota bacterium]